MVSLDMPSSPSLDIGPSQIGDDGPLHFQGIDRSGLAVKDLATRSDHQSVGDRAGPVLVQGLGECIAVTRLENDNWLPRRGFP